MRVGNQSQSPLPGKKEVTVIRRPYAILDRESKSPLPGNGDWEEALGQAVLGVTQVSLFLDATIRMSFGNVLAPVGMNPVSSHGEVRPCFANMDRWFNSRLRH